MDDEALKGLTLFERDIKVAARIRLMIFEWRRAYPSIDIVKQIGWAHVWLMSNQKNMKKDMVRFLNNWMKTEERRQGERRSDDRRAPSLPKYVEQKPPEEELFTAEDWRKMKESVGHARKP